MSDVKGLLIALEGIDGAGNTTQARLLARWLRRLGLGVVLTKEPTKGAVGRLIRRRLRRKVRDPFLDTLLFAADRAEHVASVIDPALQRGLVVVTDRYVESSIAYQGAEGADMGWVEAVNSFAPRPDLTIVLDIHPSQALARKKGVREGFEDEDFLLRVREILKARACERGYVVVDASKEVTKVHVDVKRAAEGLVKSAFPSIKRR
ncbi:MAG: dTMP kinase [Thermoprotei archaeon]|nr:MAG: dTMP kinase [Thermoprotei archaeon]